MEGKGKSTEAEEDQRGHGRRMWRGDGRWRLMNGEIGKQICCL